jgi:hypothetical protein
MLFQLLHVSSPVVSYSVLSGPYNSVGVATAIPV